MTWACGCVSMACAIHPVTNWQSVTSTLPANDIGCFIISLRRTLHARVAQAIALAILVGRHAV